MTFKIREIYYFEKPGAQNTDIVVDVVTKHVERSGIRDLVVASTSGATALEFAKALKDEARIVCVSDGPYRRELGFDWPCMDQHTKEELESLGVIVLHSTPYMLHGSLYESEGADATSPERVFRDTLCAFGQGMKVAVEVALCAVECGMLEPYKEVISVGGSGDGADTAVILRSTFKGTVFSRDRSKCLEIKEILAMPSEKKWWD